MEITVNLSLSRFKELESAEKAMNALNTDEKVFIWKYYGETIIMNRDEIIERLINLIRNDTQRNNISN